MPTKIVEEKSSIRFCGLYGQKTKKLQADCYDEYVEQFMEIAPMSENLETGELNDSMEPKLVKRKNKLNIQKEIDSYAEECDIYNIIERAQMGSASYQDMMLMLNNKTPLNQGSDILDISQIPDNLNDLHNANMQSRAVLGAQFGGDVENALKSGVPYKDLEALVLAKVKEAIDAQNASKEPVKASVEPKKGEGDK